MHKKFGILVVGLLVIMLIGSGIGTVQAQSATGFPLYPGGNSPDGLSDGQSAYNVFFDQTYTYSYSGGSVCLSSQSDQCKPPAIDDYVIIWVNGNKVVDEKSFTHDFGPVDLTPFLQNGANQIHVQLIDLVGPSEGGSALWLVPTGGGGSIPQVQPNQTVEGNSPSQPSQGQFDSGFCPGFNVGGGVYDVEKNEEGLGLMRASPSFSGTIIRREPLTTSGYAIEESACNEGYSWAYEKDLDDPSIIGWVAVANLVNGAVPVTPPEPTQAPQSTPIPQPTQIVQPTSRSSCGGLVPCVYAQGPSATKVVNMCES